MSRGTTDLARERQRYATLHEAIELARGPRAGDRGTSWQLGRPCRRSTRASRRVQNFHANVLLRCPCIVSSRLPPSRSHTSTDPSVLPIAYELLIRRQIDRIRVTTGRQRHGLGDPRESNPRSRRRRTRPRSAHPTRCANVAIARCVLIVGSSFHVANLEDMELLVDCDREPVCGTTWASRRICRLVLPSGRATLVHSHSREHDDGSIRIARRDQDDPRAGRIEFDRLSGANPTLVSPSNLPSRLQRWTAPRSVTVHDRISRARRGHDRFCEVDPSPCRSTTCADTRRPPRAKANSAAVSELRSSGDGIVRYVQWSVFHINAVEVGRARAQDVATVGGHIEGGHPPVMRVADSNRATRVRDSSAGSFWSRPRALELVALPPQRRNRAGVPFERRELGRALDIPQPESSRSFTGARDHRSVRRETRATATASVTDENARQRGGVELPRGAPCHRGSPTRAPSRAIDAQRRDSAEMAGERRQSLRRDLADAHDANRRHRPPRAGRRG